MLLDNAIAMNLQKNAMNYLTKNVFNNQYAQKIEIVNVIGYLILQIKLKVNVTVMKNLFTVKNIKNKIYALVILVIMILVNYVPGMDRHALVIQVSRTVQN